MVTKTSGVSIAKSEPWIVRQTWKVMLAISLILGLFGVMDMSSGAANFQNGETVLMHSLSGTSWDELKAENPGAANLINELSRTGGISLLTIAILSGAVILTGFRRGERWAWVTLWALPLWMLLVVLFLLGAIQYPGYGTPVPVISGSIFFTLWVACLALTYRRFFQSPTNSR
jgi:hypothetical protein